MRLCPFLLTLLCCNVDIGEPTSGGQATLTGSSSINQLDRGRRGISCASDEYKPSWKDYCCNKCTEGFYRTADCTGPGTRTNCSSCPPETFTQYANHLKKCKSCLQCDPVFNQVEVRKCESTRDRVCGCPKGMFQKKIETLTFYCQNCSSCKIVLRECSGYNDTICHCDHGQYYNTQTKECQTCDSCNQGLTCISMCSQTSAPVNHHIFILAVFSSSVLFVVVVGLMAYAMKNKWKKLSGLQSLTETGTGVQSEVSESENLKKPLAVGKTHFLIPIQEETPAESLSCPTALPGLPDCVQAAGQTLLPNNSQVNYIIADLVPASRWKEFVRRLGMNDHDIERSEMDNRLSYREAQYGMVKFWRDRQGGRGATVEAICKVLKDMELNGCAEQFQEALQ